MINNKEIIKCEDNISDEQKLALYLSTKNKSLFITGGAGTGKSFIIKKIIQEFKKMELNILITASTGTASYNINGCTIHRALGLNHTPKKEQMYSKEILINNLDVIIIDEISMISCELFDIIYDGINEIRNKNGINKKIQYIIVGDFLQLPPVDKYNDIKFAFESKNWKKCIDEIIELKINYRNKNNNYLEILKNIRNGICTDDDETFIKSLYNNNIIYDDIIPTKIYTTNKEVDKENIKNLENLKGKLYKYKMFYEKKYDASILNIEDINEKLDNIVKDFNNKLINLKIGAQIMITRNISNDIYNGIRGVITGFKENYKLNCDKIPEWKKNKIYIIKEFIQNNNYILPIIKLENNKFITLEPMVFTEEIDNSYVNIVQLPIKLCYALTVHKCQGMSINKCIIKLNSIFVSGQTFVALSRVIDIKNVKVINFNKKKVYVNNKCINFYKSIK
jgi:ATP-dependent DNA helicase PIF1